MESPISFFSTVAAYSGLAVADSGCFGPRQCAGEISARDFYGGLCFRICSLSFLFGISIWRIDIGNQRMKLKQSGKGSVA